MNKNILRGLALVGAVAVSAGASAAGDDGVAAITALSGSPPLCLVPRRCTLASTAHSEKPF